MSKKRTGKFKMNTSTNYGGKFWQRHQTYDVSLVPQTILNRWYTRGLASFVEQKEA